MAWWEGWVPASSLHRAHQRAKDKFSGTSPSWNAAAGPTAALWLTLARANWTWDEAFLLTDDLGAQWDVRSDPPAAVTEAMRRTVRRMRLGEVSALHPALVPSRPDIGASCRGARDVIVDFVHVLSPIAKGKVACIADAPEFLRKHASALLSAASGGQWTQAKKAAVPKFALTDNRCQLCFEAVGTVAHRLVCRCNMPPSGWSRRPEKANLAAHTIGQERLELVRTTGLLTVRLPAMPTRRTDTLHWGVVPGDDLPEEVTWYIDGSMLNPRRRQLATCGFALAAVTRAGDLCAWGWGVPPSWCDSASAAEAWALCTVLRISPVHGRIVTDCLGLVKTAREGTGAAVTAKRQLARVWGNIARSLDGKIDRLVTDKALIWMPAHLAANAIGRARKSNDCPVTARDWRANRLVDGLAKLAAAEGAAPAASVHLLDSAEALVKHAAAQLAVATYNANNYKTVTLRDDGTSATHTRRDSQDTPNPKKPKQLAPLKTPAAKPDSTGIVSAVAAPSDSDTSGSEVVTRRQARARAKKAAAAAENDKQNTALARVLQAPRRSAREFAIDTFRRQGVAKTLSAKREAVSDSGWSDFFNADAVAATEQRHEETPPPRLHLQVRPTGSTTPSPPRAALAAPPTVRLPLQVAPVLKRALSPTVRLPTQVTPVRPLL